MQKNISLTHLRITSIIVFFIAVFILSLSPLQDADIWFHIKMGELFAQQGLIFHEVFSYSAQGRELIPYEWLFQLSVYLLQETFGFDSIKYVTALIQTIQIGFLFLILRKIFKLNLILSFSISAFFLSSGLEFVTARPHVVAYTFYMACIYLILEYYNSAKLRWLLPILPITLVWSNLHGSMFLSVGLLGAFAGVSFLDYLFTGRKKDSLKKFITLAVFSSGAFLMTILPPLGFGQYQLLWKFFQYRDLLSRFIEEWAPLVINGFGFVFFSIVTAGIYGALAGYLIKTRKLRENLWLTPFLPFPFLAFVASRNVVLGLVSLSIILGWLLSKVNWNFKGYKKYLLLSLFLAFLVWTGWVIYQKKLPRRLYFPVEAVDFIQKYDLQGRMFNEYSYGGYILYKLYPQKQVFYDGRTEMYLCCEMPDTLELALKKYESDEQFKPTMDWLWNKYDISYTIMRSQKHSVLRKMGRILTEDPTNWSLVYWDDNSMIYVRHDGKNDRLIQDLGAKAATPYDQNPFRENMADQAFEEYQRMIKVVDSSKSRNAIGYIYLTQKKYEEAREQFTRAIELDPTNESPLMNLAELYAKDKQYAQAVDLYAKAKTLAPDRGLIYIRLGQFYAIRDAAGLEQAKQIWREGLQNTIDEDAKNTLTKLLENS